MRITHIVMLVIVGTLLTAGQVYAQNGTGDPATDPVNDCIQQMTQKVDACKDQVKQKLQDCLQEIEQMIQAGDMEQAKIQARKCLKDITQDCNQLRIQLRTMTRDCINQQLQDPDCDPDACDKLVKQSRNKQRQLSRLRINANQQIGMAVDCLYIGAGG